MEEEKKEKKEEWKKAWRATWSFIVGSRNECVVCGEVLRKSPGQIVYYCGRVCRRMRHNRDG